MIFGSSDQLPNSSSDLVSTIGLTVRPQMAAGISRLVILLFSCCTFVYLLIRAPRPDPAGHSIQEGVLGHLDAGRGRHAQRDVDSHRHVSQPSVL